MKAWREGGRRTRSPAETWARLRPLLPVFGIARVGGITGLDRVGIPVFTACRPNSRSLSVFQGKGLTADAARVSAAMEAYETWCAETVDRPLKLASMDELCFSHPLVDVARLPLTDPRGVDPQLPFLWIEGRNLMDGAPADGAADGAAGGALSDGALGNGSPRWLPFELVHAAYALPEPAHSGALAATTNGLASGNTPDEALLHGLMEVIERDAITLWKLGPAAWGNATAVRLDTVADPVCRFLLGRFAAAGIEVAAWDCRSDLGIPCFLALIRDPTGETGAPEIGGGAHPAPEVALARALTEAAQARATFIAGSREDIPDSEYAPEAVAERRRAADALFAALAPARDFGSIATVETDSFAGDIAATLAALRRAGIDEAVAVDLGKPALPFAVVRVVVPGLEAALEGPASAYVPGARAAALLTAEAAE